MREKGREGGKEREKVLRIREVKKWKERQESRQSRYLQVERVKEEDKILSCSEGTCCKLFVHVWGFPSHTLEVCQFQLHETSVLYGSSIPVRSGFTNYMDSLRAISQVC